MSCIYQYLVSAGITYNTDHDYDIGNYDNGTNHNYDTYTPVHNDYAYDIVIHDDCTGLFVFSQASVKMPEAMAIIRARGDKEF